jgi:hypothetical protein
MLMPYSAFPESMGFETEVRKKTPALNILHHSQIKGPDAQKDDQ